MDEYVIRIVNRDSVQALQFAKKMLRKILKECGNDMPHGIFFDLARIDDALAMAYKGLTVRSVSPQLPMKVR